MTGARLGGVEHLRVEGQVADHVREGLRHPGQNRGVVVAEVVAPAERVVHTAAVVARYVALEVALGPAEQRDVRRELAAVLAGEYTAGRDTRLLETERVRTVG